jgi:hypothetical protein
MWELWEAATASHLLNEDVEFRVTGTTGRTKILIQALREELKKGIDHYPEAGGLVLLDLDAVAPCAAADFRAGARDNILTRVRRQRLAAGPPRCAGERVTVERAAGELRLPAAACSRRRG